MAIDKRLKIYDGQGNEVDYDILATDVKFSDGKDLPTKLDELEDEIGEGGYAPPQGGIPKTDLAPAVQTSLGKADTALQPSDLDGYATTDDIDDAVAALVDSSPTTLDTLNELAQALGDDPNFATTMTTALGNKVDKENGKSLMTDAEHTKLQNLPTATELGNTYATKTEVNTGLGGKVDKETGKGLSSNDYTTAEKTKLAGLPTGSELNTALATKANAADLPTKTSDLTNDSGFITAEALVDVVAGNGDFVMTYDGIDTYNIVRLVPTLQVTPLSSMSASTKSGTFKVSGTNLKGDVTISLPQGASNWLLSTGGGAGASSLTLSPTNGTLAETTITVTYSGSTDSVGNTITISSTNAESKTVTANYTVTAGPTIFADTSKTVTAVAGSSATTTIEVTASQLTEGITVIKGGTNAGKFTVTPASLGTSGGTLTVQFSPNASDTANQSATITLRSAGADDVVVNITGQVLVPSLSVSPASLDFSGAAGEATSAKQIVLTGANLLNDVTVTAPSGFTVTRSGSAVSSIAKEDVMASGGVTLDVVAAGTTASGSLTFTSGTLSAVSSLAWRETEQEGVGNIVLRKYGYSTIPQDESTPYDVDIKFMITSLPNGSNHGKVKVVDSIRNSGETTFTVQNFKSTNYNIEGVEIPAAININGNIYDVTHLDECCFTQFNSSKHLCVKFSSQQNLKTLNMVAYTGYGLDPFAFTNLAGGGTGTFAEIKASKTLSLPQGVTRYGNVDYDHYQILQAGTFYVTKLITPNSLTRLGSVKSSSISYFDFGTGITTLASQRLQNAAGVKTVILRSASVISPETYFGDKTGPIDFYVPSSLKSSYETSWASYLYDEQAQSGVVRFNSIDDLQNS